MISRARSKSIQRFVKTAPIWSTVPPAYKAAFSNWAISGFSPLHPSKSLVKKGIHAFRSAVLIQVNTFELITDCNFTNLTLGTSETLTGKSSLIIIKSNPQDIQGGFLNGVSPVNQIISALTTMTIGATRQFRVRLKFTSLFDAGVNLFYCNDGTPAALHLYLSKGCSFEGAYIKNPFLHCIASTGLLVDPVSSLAGGRDFMFQFSCYQNSSQYGSFPRKGRWILATPVIVSDWGGFHILPNNWVKSEG